MKKAFPAAPFDPPKTWAFHRWMALGSPASLAPSTQDPRNCDERCGARQSQRCPRERERRAKRAGGVKGMVGRAESHRSFGPTPMVAHGLCARAASQQHHRSDGTPPPPWWKKRVYTYLSRSWFPAPYSGDRTTTITRWPSPALLYLYAGSRPGRFMCAPCRSRDRRRLFFFISRFFHPRSLVHRARRFSIPIFFTFSGFFWSLTRVWSVSKKVLIASSSIR